MAIIANSLLINGLRTEFADTYGAIRNRQSDSRLGLVMDLSIQATNREHDFAYLEAAPHMEYWQRGETIPTSFMDATQFNVPVYEWARRVPWSKWDRKDDQTQSLFDMARMAGESAALLEERFFFDLLIAGGGGTATTLPVVKNAPDGVAFFSETDGDSANRFGVSGGNIIGATNSAAGVATTHDVQADYYLAIQRFGLFKDKASGGQPLLSKETIDAGTIIIHAMADTQVFEQAFLQIRQGIGFDNAGARGGTVVAAAAETNLVHDSSRNVQLWGSSRLETGEWYVFLANPPKKATFLLDREGVQEFSSLEGDNNGDHTRSTAEEYVQWERRAGAGVALPYGAIKIDN